MDKQHFDQLVKGIREMKRHMAGKSVRGARTTSVDEPDVRAIRKAADISQSQFVLHVLSLPSCYRCGTNWFDTTSRPENARLVF